MSEGKVAPDSLVTLHYRIATADDVEIISTFASQPATLKLGNGELAPTLEACLEALSVGERLTFLLQAEQAFGQHDPKLLKRFATAELPNQGADIEAMTMVEFEAAEEIGGGKFAGLVREIDTSSALIDFNHPLAGKAIRFEVEIIGIL